MHKFILICTSTIITQKRACGRRPNWFTRFERYKACSRLPLHFRRKTYELLQSMLWAKIVVVTVADGKQYNHPTVLTVFQISPIEDIHQPGTAMSHLNNISHNII